MASRAAAQVQTAVNALLEVDPAREAAEFRHQWWTWADLKKRKTLIEAAIEEAGLGTDVRIGVILRDMFEVR